MSTETMADDDLEALFDRIASERAPARQQARTPMSIHRVSMSIHRVFVPPRSERRKKRVPASTMGQSRRTKGKIGSSCEWDN